MPSYVPRTTPVRKQEILEKREAEFRSQFDPYSIPRPPEWGGYILKPDLIEFWQGRESRLHDRLEYRKKGDSWEIVRLAP